MLWPPRCLPCTESSWSLWASLFLWRRLSPRIFHRLFTRGSTCISTLGACCFCCTCTPCFCTISRPSPAAVLYVSCENDRPSIENHFTQTRSKLQESRRNLQPILRLRNAAKPLGIRQTRLTPTQRVITNQRGVRNWLKLIISIITAASTCGWVLSVRVKSIHSNHTIRDINQAFFSSFCSLRDWKYDILRTGIRTVFRIGEGHEMS